MKKVGHQVMAYGVLTGIGGIMGYVKAGSTVSMIAGLACGGALCAGAYGLYSNRRWGWWTSLGVTALLIYQFVPSFKESGKIMPAGVMSAAGIWVLGALIIAYLQEVE
ncbi:MAG: TMEM14 family protein [bacterium]